MSTLNQLHHDLNEALDALLDGWQRLYRSAAGAITRFSTTNHLPESDLEDARHMATRNTGWGVLAAEVFDDDEKIVVRLEIPGMESDGFEIEAVDEHLVISGEKRIDRECTLGCYHITECAYGSFERAIELPGEVDAESASAAYQNGILRVELPKAAAKHRRRVVVNAK